MEFLKVSAKRGGNGSYILVDHIVSIDHVSGAYDSLNQAEITVVTGAKCRIGCSPEDLAKSLGEVRGWDQYVPRHSIASVD